MDIANELNRLINAKEAIVDSISAKGVTVPSNAMLDDMADLIELIGASAILQTGNATCGDQNCPVLYFKSGNAALVFFAANPILSGTGGSALTLPAELWDFTGGGSGDGYMWAAGSPSKALIIQPDTSSSSPGYGLQVKLMGQGAMPASWGTGRYFYGWCWLTYEGVTLPSGTDTPGSLTAVGPWHTLTLQSGFTSEYARWRTIDFGTNVQLQLKNIQGPSSLSFPANICKLPDEALPADTTYRGISCGTGNNYSRFEISPWNGYVQWYNEYPSYGSGHWIDIQCVYPIV